MLTNLIINTGQRATEKFEGRRERAKILFTIFNSLWLSVARSCT